MPTQCFAVSPSASILGLINTLQFGGAERQEERERDQAVLSCYYNSHFCGSSALGWAINQISLINCDFMN